MAELENRNEENEELEENEEEQENEEEISYEQALEWKKKAERLEKAEKKIVEFKKQSKKKDDTPINSKEELKQLLAEERFYDKNPEASQYKEKIEEYQKKGLWLDEAYFLASRNDKDVEWNREIYWKWLVKWNQIKEDMSVVSLDAFDRMTPEQQEHYSDKMTKKYWKIKLK